MQSKPSGTFIVSWTLAVSGLIWDLCCTSFGIALELNLEQVVRAFELVGFGPPSVNERGETLRMIECEYTMTQWLCRVASWIVRKQEWSDYPDAQREISGASARPPPFILLPDGVGEIRRLSGAE